MEGYVYVESEKLREWVRPLASETMTCPEVVPVDGGSPESWPLPESVSHAGRASGVKKE
jgi:hypothetical protein